MMSTQTYSPDDPLVVEKREEFLACQKLRKYNISFEEFLGRFQRRESLDNIGRAAGISGERVRQLHDRIFATFLGGKISERMRRESEQRRDTLREQLLTQIPERLVRIAEQARQRGFSVQGVPWGHTPNAATSTYIAELSISSKRCGAHVMMASHSPNPRYPQTCYAMTTLNESRVALQVAQILNVAVPGYRERFIIVPGYFLIPRIFQTGRKRKAFYVPLQTMRYGNKPPRVFVDQWEDRWDLLAPDPAA